jgi:hypothetical protein
MELDRFRKAKTDLSFEHCQPNIPCSEPDANRLRFAFVFENHVCVLQVVSSCWTAVCCHGWKHTAHARSQLAGTAIVA